MADTFDSDPNSLPPVTKALRQCWLGRSSHAFGIPSEIDAVATTFSMRAVLDAVHALELRIAALGG
jgi:hypothetical protein